MAAPAYGAMYLIGPLLSAGGDDDGRVQGAGLSEDARDVHDGRHTLADGHVHRDDAGVLVVDDRVDRDRGLAGLAVADDQLALTAADRDHRVDGLDAGLEGLLHRWRSNDRRLELERAGLAGDDVALAVERVAERVDDAAEEAVANRDVEELAGALDRVTLDDLLPVAEEHGADVVGLEVEREGGDAVRELQHLERHAVLDAVDAGDAVGDREDRTDLGQLGRAGVEAFDTAPQDRGDLVGLDLHGRETFSCGTAGLGAGRDLATQALQASTDGGVEDLIPDAKDEAADDLGIDDGVQADLLARLRTDALTERIGGGRVERDRRGDLHGQHLLLLLDETVEDPPDAEERRGAVLLDQEPEEVPNDRIGTLNRAVETIELLLGGEVRREEEHLKLPVARERIGELAELLTDHRKVLMALGDLEERSRVDLSEGFHGLVPPLLAE